MDTKHTPGPWRVRQPQKGKIGGIEVTTQSYKPGFYDLVCMMPHGPASQKQAQIDARLIASAPELLEKLEKMTRLLSFLYHNGRIKENAPGRERIQQAIVDAEYAIEKATTATE